MRRLEQANGSPQSRLNGSGGQPVRRAVVADGHPLYRQALAGLIADATPFEVVGEESDWPSALAACRRTQPDLALIALNLPGLRERLPTAQTLAEVPARRILLVVDEIMAAGALSLIAEGVCGYISKGWPPERVLAAVLGDAPAVAGVPVAHARLSQLTPRELEIVELMKGGATNSAIAEELSISISTVKTHVAQIMRKLRTRNRAQTVAHVLSAPPERDHAPSLAPEPDRVLN